MTQQVELIADYQCACGEGPLWHPIEKCLYWLDIPTGRMFRYDPATNQHEQCHTGDLVGGFTIQADGALLLFMARGAVKVWSEGALTTLIDEVAEERECNFNDVIADPIGRVLCGTVDAAERPDHFGRLYRLDVNGTLTKLLDGIGISNGLAFTPDHSALYYTDSHAREIYRFDYNLATSDISNRRLFVATSPEEGLPDGMTVDADGCVWSARWDGGCVARYSPDGMELMRVMLPVKKVTSVTFGGDDYADMYVTTAGGDNKAAEGAEAGALFRINPGIRGLPEFYSRIRL